MPEGDTIYRTARTLRAALAGQPVEAVRTAVPGIVALRPDRLVGQTVESVDSRGKHLLIAFSPSGLVLHTHMRMTGSWHLYRPGDPWRRPAGVARFVLSTPAWVAVCFAAPVVELLSSSQLAAHPALSRLGPDALGSDPDLTEARRRLDERAASTIGEALLDQAVLAGVGNVYKCEVLFIHRVDPWAKVADVPGPTRDALLATAQQLLARNVAPGAFPARVTTAVEHPARGQRLHVYGKAGRPCPRCGTRISADRQGDLARITFWCGHCQPAEEH